LFISQLPHWLGNDTFYGRMSHRTVTSACLMGNSCLPPIPYKADGSIVQVRLSCLFRILPPPETYWLKLYSWPLNFSRPTDAFGRVFNLEVFQIVKSVLGEIGYQFTEE